MKVNDPRAGIVLIIAVAFISGALLALDVFSGVLLLHAACGFGWLLDAHIVSIQNQLNAHICNAQGTTENSP